MPKWYVQSGQVVGVVHADRPEEACRRIIQRDRVDVERLSVITTVSETGFALTEDSIVMLTSQVLGDSYPTTPS